MFDRICKAGGEREQIQKFMELLKPGDVVWDVGTFIGMYSLFSSHAVGSKGKIYSFEPEPKTAQRAQRNFDLNGSTTIRLLECALGAEDGLATIYPSKADENAIHSLKPNARRQTEGIQITVHRGDSLVEKNEAELPNAIKMDIEGAEHLALSGMQNILNDRRCRMIFLELHPEDLPAFGASAEQVRELIQSAGFKLDHEQKRGSEFHQFYLKTA